MRKLSNLLAFKIITIFIITAFFVSCRKSAQDSNNTRLVEDNKTENKFSVPDSTEKIIKLLAAKFARQNNENRFIESLVAVAGNAFWDKAIVVRGKESQLEANSSQRSKRKKAKAFVYVPFVKKSEKRTAAILKATIYEKDTVLTILYPQQYKQYGFGRANDSAWNARDLFNVFANFDHDLFGTKIFRVYDGRIFGMKVADTVLATIEWNIISNTRSTDKMTSVQICNTVVLSCVYASTGPYPGGGNCPTTTTCTTYWVDDGSGSGTAGSGSGSPITNPPPIPTNPCVGTPSISRSGEKAPTGPSVPCTLPWKPEDIVNDVTDPCLKKMVNDAISRDCSNEISNFINSAFGKNPNLDLVFNNAPLGNIWGEDAKTVPHLGGANKENCYITITLNSSTGSLPGASKEYIAITIMHEAIHAWITISSSTSNSSNNVSHETMASSANINLMANSLREMYPGISLQDAKDLAWGGLDKTAGWAALSQADKNRIIQANYDYKKKIKGLPCTP